MKAVHSKVYTVQPLHAQFIVYSVKCAMYSVYCTLYTVQYTPLHALDITGGWLDLELLVIALVDSSWLIYQTDPVKPGLLNTFVRPPSLVWTLRLIN